MIITNKQGLPEAFVKMAQREESFDDNEVRVTSLLCGLREAELKRRYRDRITQDCSDMIWLLFGTACHSILESQTEGSMEFKEERLKMKFGELTLTGKSDLYNADTQTVTDYKTCSVWKVIFGDYEDWQKQLALYAMLWEHAGFKVRHGEIHAILKDHSKAKAKVDPEYPQLPVVTIRFDFTDEDIKAAREYAEERLRNLAFLRDAPDASLPICTPEERYNSGDKYAVMKKGRKTALRVFDSMEEAEAYKADKGGDYIETRPGEDKKCADYCMVREFCPYAQEKAVS